MAAVAYRRDVSGCVEAERDAVHAAFADGRFWGILTREFKIWTKVFGGGHKH